MPYFIDWHEGRLDDDMHRKVEARIDSGERDEFGVADRGIVMDRESNRMYCILDAPDAEAVRKHHEKAGVAVESIHPADVMLPR